MSTVATKTFESVFRATIAPEKARLLLSLSWELTLVGRDAWSRPLPEAQQIQVLKMLNEMQHSLSQAAEAYLQDSNYNDEVLLGGVRSCAEMAGLESYFDQVLRYSLQRYEELRNQEERNG